MKIRDKITNRINISICNIAAIIIAATLLNMPTLANNNTNTKVESVLDKKDSIKNDDDFLWNNVHFEEWNELGSESANATFVSGEITVLEDGSTRGKVKTVTKGSEAEAMRKLLVEIENFGASYVAAQMLRRQNLEGHANLQEIKTAQHQFVAVDAAFTLSNRIEKDGSFRIPLSSGIRVVQMPQTRYLKALRENNKPDDLCKSRFFEQKIVFIMPKGNFIILEHDSFPNSIKIEISDAIFRARYSLQEGKLFVQRQFYIKSLENDCSDEVINEKILAIRAAAREFNRVLTLSPMTQ